MITVVGSGAFGTALAITLAGTNDVVLWARDAEHVSQMATARENARRLPGVRFPKTLSVTADADRISPQGPILLAVPMQQLRSVVSGLGAVLERRQLVACCKGIELGTGAGPCEILGMVPGAIPAVLTGPSFAADIARGLPTALTLACADAGHGKALQQALTTPTVRIYRTTDVVGAQLGGALKNVIAIAAGAVMGAGLGESARAALMTRGYAEMARMVRAMGGQAETLAGLAGFGDLVLTCTSTQSRNYAFGQSIGCGEAFDPLITVEGAATARATLVAAQSLNIDMPITAAVVAILDGTHQIEHVMSQLLSRPLKEE